MTKVGISVPLSNGHCTWSLIPETGHRLEDYRFSDDWLHPVPYKRSIDQLKLLTNTIHCTVEIGLLVILRSNCRRAIVEMDRLQGPNSEMRFHDLREWVSAYIIRQYDWFSINCH